MIGSMGVANGAAKPLTKRITNATVIMSKMSCRVFSGIAIVKSLPYFPSPGPPINLTG
jgi:hypothetical protein